MSTVRLKEQLDELRRTGSCHVFVVCEITPLEVMVLVVPKGSEHLEVSNPMGMSVELTEYEKIPADAWVKVTQPRLCCIKEDGKYDVVRPFYRPAEVGRTRHSER